MADLEQRVTTLEREVTALKSRVGANEADVTSIPDLIKLEFRLGNSRLARLSQDVADLKVQMEAMPRVVAETVAEFLAERDRKR